MSAVTHLLRRLESSGIPTEELKLASDGGEMDRDVHGMPASIWTMHRVLEALSRVAPPDVGLRLGSHWRQEDYEPFGSALRSCNSLVEVTAVLRRFHLHERQLSFFRHRLVDDEWEVEFAPSAPFGSAGMIIMEELLSRSQVETSRYLGEALQFNRIELAYPAPDHKKEYDRFGCRVLFGRPRTIVSMKREYFFRPLRKPDSADEEYGQLLGQLGLRQRVALAILETLVFHPGSYPSMQCIAEIFDVSVSTVKRWLANEDMNYRTLVDIARCEHVAEYLAFSSLAPKEIAHRLGFTNVNNFRRAFNRWMGMTPAEFRATMREGMPIVH